MEAPFGIQIVFYLFLAGVAAGSAFVASLMLHRGDPNAFTTGKRSLVLAIVAISVGVMFLVADLANPAEFFLILTKANAKSAIAWGARIVVSFSLIAIFCWALYRTKTTGSATGLECAALWFLRLLAVALAIYPGFVLLQGKGVTLWNTWLVVPLVALSGLHAGFAASTLLAPGHGDVLPRNQKLIELGMIVAMLVLTNAFIFTIGGHLLAYLFLVVGLLLPFVLLNKGPAVVSSVSVLVGSFILRAWLITDGQSLFF